MSKVDDKYAEYLNIFNGYLQEFILCLEKNTPEIIREAIIYSLNNGGKRVRPVLCLAVADALGVSFERVKNYCIAVELIHTYSLVHDDLPAMDNDDYRRGKLSTHKKFGEAFGILAGDALLNLAFEKCLDNSEFCKKDLDACKVLFDFSGYKGMVSGQVLDLQNENSNFISEQMLNDVYYNKTAKLLTAPLLIPSILAENKHYDNLMEYGLNLGMTFQIVDDLMDVEGSFESIGKTPNKDVGVDKLTSIKVYGLDGARKKAKEYYLKTLEAVKDVENNEFLVSFAKKLFERKS